MRSTIQKRSTLFQTLALVGGNSPQPDFTPTEEAPYTNEPVIYARQKRKMTEMRSPSPDRHPDSSHETTVTSIREYKKGDLAGGNAALPPLMLGDWRQAYSMSYNNMYEENKYNPPHWWCPTTAV